MTQTEFDNKIEKLTYYSSSKDGYNWDRHPTIDDVVAKINELIDILNGEANDKGTR